MSKLYVSFIWHMHQPYYKDNSENLSMFPWVRLHGIKNYYNMVSILKEFPKIRQTFNLVPGLLLQIKEYLEGKTTDLWLEKTLKRVSELDDKDKKFILDNFFLLNKEKMGFIFPRFKELYHKKINREEYTPQDFLDLQVLYNLAWFDPDLRKRDSFLNHLVGKGRNFTEEEKRKLIDKQFEILGKLFSLYKTLQESGQIEIIFSPFFHPIMPLLIDINSAKVSTPELPLPFDYFSFIEDAEKQLLLGKDYYKEIFNRESLGIWPSEQAISPEFIKLISKFGIKWFVSDEKVLFKSLGEKIIRDREGFISEPEVLYKPYKINLGGKEVFGVFRDQFLSDRIGFVYMNYSPEDGAKDLYSRLLKIKKSLPQNLEFLVTIALDGENCWEYYDNDGREFLRNLYSLLSDSEEIETTTVKDFIEKTQNFGELNNVFTGSWINADLTTWIGEIEENVAWEYLTITRKLVEKREDQVDWISLMAAEGSDWFWWYGDDQESGYDEIFDDIFRAHLKNVYRSIGKDYPSFLDFPIVFRNPLWRNRKSLIFTPHIDGIITSEDEWALSSLNLLRNNKGKLVTELYFGYDFKNLYFRLDLKDKAINYLSEDYRIFINFYSKDKTDYTLSLKLEKNPTDNVLIGVKDIIEIGIPWEKFSGFDRRSKIYFEIELYKNTERVEKLEDEEKFFFRIPNLMDEIITKLFLSKNPSQKVEISTILISRKNLYNLYSKINVTQDILQRDFTEVENRDKILKVTKHISLRELLFLIQSINDLRAFGFLNGYVLYPIGKVSKIDGIYVLEPKNILVKFLEKYVEKEKLVIPVEKNKFGRIEIYGLGTGIF